MTDNSELYAHAQALRDAISHLRAAIGVLDTYAPTRKRGEDVELVTKRLEKDLEPLEKEIAEIRTSVRRA